MRTSFLVADQKNSVIRKVDLTTGLTSTYLDSFLNMPNQLNFNLNQDKILVANGKGTGSKSFILDMDIESKASLVMFGRPGVSGEFDGESVESRWRV